MQNNASPTAVHLSDETPLFDSDGSSLTPSAPPVRLAEFPEPKQHRLVDLRARKVRRELVRVRGVKHRVGRFVRVVDRRVLVNGLAQIVARTVRARIVFLRPKKLNS